MFLPEPERGIQGPYRLGETGAVLSGPRVRAYLEPGVITVTYIHVESTFVFVLIFL